MECEFCKNSFATKANLKCHQKNTKYCLEIQGNIENKIMKYYCKYCNKELCKGRLVTHENKCNGKNQKILTDYTIEKLSTELKHCQAAIIQKDKIIENLKLELEFERKDKVDRLERLSLAGINKQTNNKTINILQPLTKEYLDSKAKNITKQHVLDGIEGIARHAAETLTTDYINCSDASRGTLKIKQEDGKMIKDVRGKKTIKNYCQSIQDPVTEIVEICKSDLIQNEEDTSEQTIENCKTMHKYDKLKNSIKKTAEGKETELGKKLIYNIVPNITY